MSLETISDKKGGRVYHRMFDHDEARRLRAEGWSWGKLADRFGVSSEAVRRVCDPRVRARLDEASKAWLRANRREPCKGGCGRLVWTVNKDRTGYCQACLPRPEIEADVGDGELRCTACREWKPDSEFATSKPSRRRRNHNPECRKCESRRRREQRHRHPEQERAQNQRLTDKRRKRGSMARYIVFQPNGSGFVETARVDAGSPAHAIEQAAKDAGEYVAVLEGRFRLMRVEPVQALRVVSETATAQAVAPKDSAGEPATEEE